MKRKKIIIGGARINTANMTIHAHANAIYCLTFYVRSQCSEGAHDIVYGRGREKK